jgi:hypothetical protein
VPRLAVILYAERHQPRGGYAAMFRCVARLRAQHPELAWYGAFGDEQPTIAYVVRDAQRYSTAHPLVIPWTLTARPHLDASIASAVTMTQALGAHTLIHDIFVQRANESHYLRSPADYHGHTAQTIFVGDANTTAITMTYHHLNDIVAHAATHTGDVILQPLALSQNDPLVHAITQQTARGMPLERFGMGRAVEYDRRLLKIINDIVHQHR